MFDAKGYGEEGTRRVGESDWDLYLEEAEYGARK